MEILNKILGDQVNLREQNFFILLKFQDLKVKIKKKIN